jgi:hypothetical protein
MDGGSGTRARLPLPLPAPKLSRQTVSSAAAPRSSYCSTAMNRESASFRVEVVGVEFLYIVCLRNTDAHIEVDHQLSQFHAVDQYNAWINSSYVLNRVGGEAACSKEYSFLGTFPVKSTDKLLDFRTSNGFLPTFSLEIDDIKAKAIFVNDTINTIIIAV